MEQWRNIKIVSAIVAYSLKDSIAIHDIRIKELEGSSKVNKNTLFGELADQTDKKVA